MTDKLENIVDKICAYHSEHDTREFYNEVHLCLAECLTLIDSSLLDDEEIDVISQSKRLLQNNDVDKMQECYSFISGRWQPKERKNEKRNYALRAIMSVFITFDDYGDDECYRSETLEFCVGYLLGSGVHGDKIYMLLTKRFASIL